MAEDCDCDNPHYHKVELKGKLLNAALSRVSTVQRWVEKWVHYPLHHQKGNIVISIVRV